jgi:hypothetical protein
MEAVTNSGASGAEKVKVWKKGVFPFAATGMAITDIGKPAYVLDDQTVGLAASATHDVCCGLIVGYISATKVLVDIGWAGLNPDVTALVADLVSVAHGSGASTIGVEDSAGHLAATDVEAALAEIFTLLASVANTEGASLIGVEDAAANFAATDVEAALAEIMSLLASVLVNEGASLVGVYDVADIFTGATVEAVLAEIGAKEFPLGPIFCQTVAGGATVKPLEDWEWPNNVTVTKMFLTALTAPGGADTCTATISDGVTGKSVVITAAELLAEDKAVAQDYAKDTDMFVSIAQSATSAAADINLLLFYKMKKG